jgi:Zn-dependent protease with chaperone function
MNIQTQARITLLYAILMKVLLLFFSLSFLVWFVLIIPMNMSFVFQNIIMTTIVICCFAILTMLSIYGICIAYRYTSDPLGNIFGVLRSSAISNEQELRVHNFFERLRIPIPKFLGMESRIPNAYSFTVEHDNYIIVTNSLLELVDQDELDIIICHEAYHFAYDTPQFSLGVLVERLFDVPISSLKSLSLAFAVFVIWIAIQRGYSWHIHEWQYVIINSIMRFGLVSMIILVTTAIPMLLFGFGRLPSRDYLYTREILADSYASIITKEPMKLHSCISKIERERHFGKIEFGGRLNHLERVSFFSIRNRSGSENPLRLSDLVATKPIGRTRWIGLSSGTPPDPEKYRKSLLGMMNRLLTEKTTVRIASEGVSRLPKSMMLTMPIAILEVLRNEAAFIKFLRYVEDRRFDFNLMECSEHLKLDPFHVFLFLFAAVRSGIMDIEFRDTLTNGKFEKK